MALEHYKLPDMPFSQRRESFRSLEMAEDREHEAAIEGFLLAQSILFHIELTKAGSRIQIVEHRHPGSLKRHVLGMLQTETAFRAHRHRKHRICPDIAGNIKQGCAVQNTVRNHLQTFSEIRAAAPDDISIIEENRLI